MKKYLLLILLVVVTGCSPNAKDLEEAVKDFLSKCEGTVHGSLQIGNKGNAVTYTCNIKSGEP